MPQLYAKGETPREGRLLDPTKSRGSLRHVAPALAPQQQAGPPHPTLNPSPSLNLPVALNRTLAIDPAPPLAQSPTLSQAPAPTRALIPTLTLSQAAPSPSPRYAAYSQRRADLVHVPPPVAPPPSARPESLGALLSK